MPRKALLILLILITVMIPASCAKRTPPPPVGETVTPLPFEAEQLAPANVAREGFAVASSSKYDKGYSNLYINDGDLSRGFSTQWDQSYDPAAPHYILIDLAGVQTVEAVKLYPLKGDEAGFPVDFDILVSMDNENYTKVASVDGASADQAKNGFAVNFDPVEAAYVKLVTRKTGMGSGDKGAYLSIAEMEVIGAVTTGTNMILNRSDIWLYRDPDTTQKLEIVYYRDGKSVDSNKKLYYSSEDPSVAAVDATGLISPVSVGETVIYVYDDTNRAACHVTVKEEQKDEFRISAFYHSTFGSPETYVKGLEILKGAGVEYIEDTRFCDRVGNNITMYMIYLCNKLGLAYSVCDQEGGEGGFLKMSDEQIISIVDKYKNRAGLYGIYLCDEPHEEYTQYAEVHRLIQEYDPHIIPHLNLLPPFNFGGTEEYFTEYAAVAGGARRMRFLSFDFYPFRVGGTFVDSFYGSIDMVREAGVKYNADTGYYLQSMIITGSYPLLYEKELRYNASLGAAYGMKNYKWFVALTPIGTEGESFQTGLVGPDFEPADNYDAIIAANKMIKNLGRYLGDFDAVEVYHTKKGSGVKKVPDSFLLRPEDNNQAIYTLYQANNGSGRQHILVTSKNYKKKDSVVLKFSLTKDAGELRIYDPLTDQESALTAGEDGIFAITLEPGGCALILLPEGTDASTPSEPSDNLALGKAVFVSSSRASFWEKGNIGTHYLTDGKPNKGYWISDRGDNNSELLLDLGSVNTVGRILLYWHFDLGDKFCKQFTVSVSTDGVNYTEVANVSTAVPAALDEPCVCAFDPVNARYIRIRLLDNGSGKGSGFGEIEVYKN